MNTQKTIYQVLITFIGLSVAGIGLVVGAQMVANSFTQTVMVSIGSAIFGAGLAFFLIRFTSLMDK